MDLEKQALLKRKLEDLKKKQSQQRQNNEKKQIIENIDDFYEKYRFADEYESVKIEEFIRQLHFSSPAHIAASHASAPMSRQPNQRCHVFADISPFQVMNKTIFPQIFHT